MNYVNLPPGRKRRLEYSKYIKDRQQRRRNFNLEQVFNVQRYRTDRPVIQYNPIYNETYYIYRYANEISQSYNLQIKNLLEHTVVENNINKTDMCVICQDNINNNDIIRKIINCSHIFHINCIDTWFSKSTKCPLCNFALE